MSVAQTIYILIHVILAAVVMTFGCLGLFGRWLPPSTGGAILLIAAATVLIFHGAKAVTFRSKK